MGLVGTPATGYNTSNQYLSVTHTLAAGENRQVIAFCSYKDTGGARTPTVTYDYGGGGAVGMTSMTSVDLDDGAAWWGCDIFRLPEASLPSNGAYTVRMDGGAGCNNLSLSVFAWDALEQEAHNDSHAQSAEAIYTETTTLSSITLPSVIFGAWSVGASACNVTAVGSGQTEILNFDATLLSQYVSYEVAGGTSDTQSMTQDSGNTWMGNLSVAMRTIPIIGGSGVAMTPILMI